MSAGLKPYPAYKDSGVRGWGRCRSTGRGRAKWLFRED